MDYLVKPLTTGISTMGNCSCGTNYCNSKSSTCTGNCSTLEVCVTPTGAKVSPMGLGSVTA